MNISYEHMNKIERARRGCSIELLMELADYFEVSTDYILTGHDYANVAVKSRLRNVLSELDTLVQSLE